MDHIPLHKSQFIPDPLPSRQCVFEIIYCPSTFRLWQLFDKLVEILIVGSLEHDDASFIVGETVDDVGEFLALFELLESFQALGSLPP